MDEKGNGRDYDATPAMVAKVYGVSAATVRRWAEARKVPFRNTPSGPRFNLEELDQHFLPEDQEPAEVEA